MRRETISVGAVWICLLVPAVGVAQGAEIVSVNLPLVVPSGDINRLNVNLSVTILGVTDNDDDTAMVTGNILADLTMDFNPVTHGAVAAGLEFTGGVFELSPLDFTLDYGVLGTLTGDGQDMLGTMDTPLPPAAVTEGQFLAEEHVAIISHGTITIEGHGLVLGTAVAKTTLNLADNPIPAVGQGTGTLTVSAPDINDGVGTYDVTVDLRMELDGEFTDEGSGVTARGTGTGRFRAQGQFSRTLPLPGDADGNGVVNAADYIALKMHMDQDAGATLADGDFDGDDDVDWHDLQLLQAHYGDTSAGAGTIPEPATLSLLALGGLALLWRRGRVW